MSTAQEIRKRRQEQGLDMSPNKLNYTDSFMSLDSYYENIISDDDIERELLKYSDNIELVENDFNNKTGLNKVDVLFLATATAAQCVRQYMLTRFRERVDDQQAAKNTKGHDEEHSNRSHQYYKPSVEEIITNPVPFDANVGANGALSGAGKMGHRVAAIGHDPILGLVFGTANIATSTLTNYKLESFHIKTGATKKDTFTAKADTHKVIQETIDKLQNDNVKYGKNAVAASLVKEIIHLKSDISTTNSLPLPFVSVIDAKLASKLAEYGFDTANAVDFGKQMAGSILINTIISMTHGLYGIGAKQKLTEEDERLFKVRTRKILLISNLIATSSNVIYSAITKNFNTLDLGGFAVTSYRLFSDPRFMQKIKYEYINNNVSKIYADKIKEAEFYLS